MFLLFPFNCKAKGCKRFWSVVNHFEKKKFWSVKGGGGERGGKGADIRVYFKGVEVWQGRDGAGEGWGGEGGRGRIFALGQLKLDL